MESFHSSASPAAMKGGADPSGPPLNRIASFPLGQVVATPGALALLASLGLAPAALLARHASGDWGDLDPRDATANAEALADGGRLFSAYIVSMRTGHDDDPVKVWIITEADRSSTCVLLPSEY